ncbi:UDP-4-amino-4,6-dideoxy-N-acetyl-beta-L-altrosamine transaminase [Psychrosphaera sp. 1_MG-2023]|uniref:UDP-4-amino-4, 6-dideoxy-N-acetyl-beta-L-altrosamine transaminase n=1 Tax=Psychrosphaera sp. 1_MG-2023 TaxID=3062643 RepID=UPI0026E1514F|nr:UDP-4-amino-4,6-dideoxy-N-acetyl-beta-L-altrosamine transaminase [Psychrosphaera sp. 1_MG-2023]MDO6718384.1 UDP-4-amino-4,6-dideoxy-N-acetyl-beta-L-altrosamine transaminase [Psychrosphaera sp. 1_MG-2023]
MISYGKQHIEQADIDAVIDVLKSDFLTQGPAVAAFESAFASYTGSTYCVAVNSGTSALHMACNALGVEQGSLVWTTPISFAASANCALYCGATVDFVDIELNTGLMCLDTLERKLLKAKQNCDLPNVVIPVHYAGQSVDMAKLRALADEFGFGIIEDACHATGAKYNNEPVGNCQYSDISVFSFHPVKNMTTAEGGAATTNNATIAQSMQQFRTHGITKSPDVMLDKDPAPWYYEQHDLGFNYRLSDIHAALGISQLAHLDDFIEKRNQIAAHYDSLFESSTNVATIKTHSFNRSGFHLYPILLQDEATRREVYDSLRANDVICQVHYLPIYQLPYYQNLGFKSGYCPNAESFYKRELSIPIFVDLTYEQQELVVSLIKQAIS